MAHEPPIRLLDLPLADESWRVIACTITCFIDPMLKTVGPLWCTCRYVYLWYYWRIPCRVPGSPSTSTGSSAPSGANSVGIRPKYNQKVYIFAHAYDESNKPWWPFIGCIGRFQGSYFSQGTEYAHVQSDAGLSSSYRTPDWMNNKTMETDRAHIYVPYDMVYRLTREYTGIYPARVMSEPGKTIQKRSRTPSP